MRPGPAPGPPGIPVELPQPRAVEHGSLTAYSRFKCRCQPCTDHRRRTNRVKLGGTYGAPLHPLKSYGEPVELPTPRRLEHGSLRAYNKYKCRCLACLERRRSYDNEYWELKKSVQDKERKR